MYPNYKTEFGNSFNFLKNLQVYVYSGVFAGKEGGYFPLEFCVRQQYLAGIGSTLIASVSANDRILVSSDEIIVARDRS